MGRIISDVVLEPEIVLKKEFLASTKSYRFSRKWFSRNLFLYCLFISLALQHFLENHYFWWRVLGFFTFRMTWSILAPVHYNYVSCPMIYARFFLIEHISLIMISILFSHCFSIMRNNNCFYFNSIWHTTLSLQHNTLQDYKSKLGQNCIFNGTHIHYDINYFRIFFT